MLLHKTLVIASAGSFLPINFNAMTQDLEMGFHRLVVIVLIGASFFTYGMKKAEHRLSCTYDVVPKGMVK